MELRPKSPPSFRRNRSFGHHSIRASFLARLLQNQKERPRRNLSTHFPWKFRKLCFLRICSSCSWCVIYSLSRFALPGRGKQGIEGTHVTYHEDYSPEDDDALQGVRFAVSKRLGTPRLRVWIFSPRYLPTLSRPITTRSSRKGPPTRNLLHRNFIFYRVSEPS